MRRAALRPVASSSLSLLLLLIVSSTAGAGTLSGSAALTTDYVFRGVSQTLGDPAAQFGVRWQSEPGLYVATWGSTVEFPGDNGASSELDYVVGWSGSLTDAWALDASVTYFDYPSARADLSYAEFIATFTYDSNYWLTLGYSPDVFATSETGIYAQLGAKFPFNDAWRIEAAAGYYELDDAYGDSYAHGQLGVVWAVRAPIELRLTAHATDSSAKALFPGLAGGRLEAAVSAAF